MRKYITFITVVGFALIFACCQQYTADIEEFLSYWSAEASVTGFKINSVYYRSDVGVACLPSDREATVILTVRNPKKFRFVMPSTVSDAAAVIRFLGLPSQPSPGTDYTLRQSAPDTLELTYKSTFLKKYEWGTADIGPVITLKSDGGRQFAQTFSTSIVVNTLPPEITKTTIAKTTGSPAYYVVCCEIDGSKILDPVNSGGKLHGDIAGLRVTKDGGAEEFIPIGVNAAGTDFDITHSGGKLLPPGSVTRLFSDASYAVPSGPWVVYLKTGIRLDDIAALPHTYGIRLADAKNLTSGAQQTRTLGYIVDTSNHTEAWKKVREAVTNVAAGGVVTLSGVINATNHSGNHGHIEISKNLTVQGAPGNPPAVLDAQHLGPPSSSTIAESHRIFTVTGAVEVTLQNLTLRNGKDAVDAHRAGSGGGGIFARANANLTLINVTVEDCISKASGGGIRYDHDPTGGGRLTMINCTIKNNTVKDDGSIKSSLGGGISLPWSTCTAVIDGCTITGNKIDMSTKTNSSDPHLEAKGCGIDCSARIGITTIIKGHTVIEDNQCVPHPAKTCNCQGMGIFCGGGSLTIGETGKSDAESPEILHHGRVIPPRVNAHGTALYIDGGTVDWLSGKIYSNGSLPTNSVYSANNGTFNNQSGNSAS